MIWIIGLTFRHAEKTFVSIYDIDASIHYLYFTLYRLVSSSQLLLLLLILVLLFLKIDPKKGWYIYCIWT